MNCVRKHLSAIKGGRLAALASPARIVALIISDVPGDNPSVIASGPTVADATTSADAVAVLKKYKIDVSESVLRHLASTTSETPKPGDTRLEWVENRIVATPQMALEAAAVVARRAGVTPLILGDAIEGGAKDVGLVHAGIALHCRRHAQPAAPPCVFLSGGETTVTVRSNGRGGRNQEFLLSLATALDGAPGISALAADTDGLEGSEDNAGALMTPTSLVRARAVGIDCKAMLANNDAYSVFAALGDLVVSGPTLTNVNDFRAVLVDGLSKHPASSRAANNQFINKGTFRERI